MQKSDDNFTSPKAFRSEAEKANWIVSLRNGLEVNERAIEDATIACAQFRARITLAAATPVKLGKSAE